MKRPMSTRVKLRRMGGSVGITIPKAMSERLHLESGQEVFAVATDHGVLITPYDPDFELAMEAYRQGAARYRNALRDLAK